MCSSPSRQDGDGSDESPTSLSGSSARSSPPPSALPGHTEDVSSPSVSSSSRRAPSRFELSEDHRYHEHSISLIRSADRYIAPSARRAWAPSSLLGPMPVANAARPTRALHTRDSGRTTKLGSSRVRHTSVPEGESCEHARSATASATIAPFERWNVR
jgi:hypothetical protein